jgi:hypothetical protein
MAIRETLQKSKFFGFGLVVLLFAAAASMAVYSFWSSGPHVNRTGAFYSDDDGKSYYSDSIYHFPPFDHHGATAYLAMIYSGKSGNFVGYLERYTPETKKLLEDAYAKASSGEQPTSSVLSLLASLQGHGGIEFKYPGSGNKWEPKAMLPPPVKAPDGGACYMVLP